MEKSIKVSFKGNSYEMSFPNTGKLIDLEQRKSRLISPNNNNASLWAYNLAIAIETFRTLIPKLEEDLNIKQFEDMDLMDSRDIVKVYIEEVKPWFDAQIREVSDIFGEKDE
jgi:hypothetical protein